MICPAFLRPSHQLSFQLPFHLSVNAKRHTPSKTTPRRLRRPPVATVKPPTPYTPEVRALLSEIATFTGSETDAERLTSRVLTAATNIPPPSPDDTNPSRDGVTALYNALRDARLLRAFAALRAPPGAAAKNKAVSVPRLVAQAGLPLSALVPRRSTLLAWQLAGVAAVAVVAQTLTALGLQQYARPAILAAGAAFVADQLALRGMVFEAAYRALFPAYAEKVLQHEAGHFLAAYLQGLAVRGYVLSASEAMRAGIPGQAGTLFSDDDMYEELKKGKLSNRAIDRYSIVSMAGIAAEAINYGEAEGGESDVQALLRLLTTLQPPWTEQNVRSHARWAVLEAILLLRGNDKAFSALCDAMRQRKSLAECVQCIEHNFVLPEDGVPPTSNIGTANANGVVREEACKDDITTTLDERELAVMEELERVRRQVEDFGKQQNTDY